MKLQHTILLTLSVATSCLGAVVVDIEADVTNLTGNLTTFTTSLSAFDPNNFLVSGIGLLFAAQGVLQALNESTTDAQNLNHPVKNPTTLISAVTPLSTTIPNALSAIASAKPQFDALPTSGGIADGAVGGILVALQNLVQEFSTGVIAALPTAQQSSLISVQNTINAAFTSTIATFGENICPSQADGNLAAAFPKSLRLPAFEPST